MTVKEFRAALADNPGAKMHWSGGVPTDAHSLGSQRNHIRFCQRDRLGFTRRKLLGPRIALFRAGSGSRQELCWNGPHSGPKPLVTKF